jgi:serine/threonine-protein kinase
MPSPPLKQIGKYQLVDILGEGAMGVVYRAYDQVLNRYLAIKVMSASIGNNAQLRERFLREARAAGSLQHPNVVTIYDFGEEDDHLFIAMEFVDGVDLAEIIRRRDELALTTKLDIMIDMLNGLAYAHNRGVVHRDIKPANIRVTTDTRAKLMDFGIAYLQQSELTQSGVLVGTPQYMAPEQVSGGAITAATDVFAAGAVLYEFVSHRRPFEGETLHVILYNIMSTEPPSISEVMPKAPVGLDAVIRKALAKDPAARYDSAVSMSKALAGVRQGISPMMDAATLSLRTSHSPGGPPPATALRTSQIQGMIATEVARRQKRTTWTAIGGASAAVLATVHGRA